MKRGNLLVTVLSLAGVLLFSSCKSDNGVNSTPQNVEIKNEAFAEYTLLTTAAFYKQSTILTEYNGSLYRFGTLEPVQVYNLNNSSWSNLPLPDSSCARWDGAALNIDGTIYVLAVFNAYTNPSYDILKYDPASNKYEHTGVNLPKYFDYPAYCKYNKNIYFLSAVTDSVCRYDVSANKLTKIASNPFYAGGQYAYSLFSSGVFQNYFYVFKATLGSGSANRFYRFNLSSNTWEILPLPASIENKKMFGGSLGSSMILFYDSQSAYKYDYNSGEWTVDTSPVAPLAGDLFDEWSFCSRDSCLYGSTVALKNLWKITLK